MVFLNLALIPHCSALNWTLGISFMVAHVVGPGSIREGEMWRNAGENSVAISRFFAFSRSRSVLKGERDLLISH